MLRPENIKAVDEAEEGEADDCEPAAPGLHDGGVVGQVLIGDALGFAGFVEAEVDDAAADPADEARGVG